MQPAIPTPAPPLRRIPVVPLLAVAALLVAAACTQATPCDGPADCDDRDANTTDTCNADGACEYAPICSGADCTKNPCSPSFVAEGGLKIAVLDVGQGDAIAVVAPSGCAALVDGGPTFSGSIIRGYLRTQGVTKVDFAVASHYHADHLGGLDEVEQGSDPMPVMRTYDRGRSQAPTDSSSYDQYASNYGDRRQQVAVGDSFALCEEVCFQVVAVNANGVSTEDENARSVVLRLRYGAFTMLLGGDLTGGVESDISSRVGEVDVYKVHHHGSASSSTSGFLSKLRPTASVVSVGWDNSFGHPSAAALDRLDSVESSVWKTESYTRPLGNVEISVDSATGYTVSQGTARAEFTIKPGK